MNIPFLDKFPVDAIILQKRGSGVLCYRDKARYLTKSDQSYYQLKKTGTKFRPSTFDNMLPQSNGRPLVILYEYARDMLVPVDATELEVIYERDDKGNIIKEIKKNEDGTKTEHNKVKRIINLKAIEEDMAFWGQEFRRQAEIRHSKKGFLEQYMPFILMGMTFVFYVILTYFFSNAISEASFNVVEALQKVVINQPPAG